jgi:hypothetical protein
MPQTINYKFSQTFNISAQAAYEWCTDFDPDDPALMAEGNATREVKKLTDKTLILKETFRQEKDTIIKEKLVQFYPDRLMWISTHISGPNKHSQFIYEIAAETDHSSRLDFTAQHIEHKTGMSHSEIMKLEEDLCRYDSDVWKLLAKAMENERS